ncbi:hypothetical protein LEMLEM_LOCUS25099 [Lemmus lemmus]
MGGHAPIEGSTDGQTGARDLPSGLALMKTLTLRPAGTRNDLSRISVSKSEDTQLGAASIQRFSPSASLGYALRILDSFW